MRAGARRQWTVGGFAAALGAVAALALSGAVSARAACPVAGVPIGCTTTTTPPPAPDPGGTEADQPVPTPGKAWGFNLGYKPTGDASATASLDAMAALGVTHLRYGVSWRGFGTTSPTRPVTPEMSAPFGDPAVGSGLRAWDDEYLDLTARGITPVLILWDVPLWASTLHNCSDVTYQALHPQECPANWQQGQHQPAPEYYPQFRAWVAAMTRRYPLAIVEGANEPYLGWNHKQAGEGYPHAVDATTAADIQCELFQAVRSVDNRTVLSMSMNDSPYERTFIARASACYDALSFHAYPGQTTFGAGSKLATDFRNVREARAAAGDTKPIWVTETGYAFVPSGNAADDAYWENQYADASRRLYNRLVTMSDVRAVMFHTLRDAPQGQTVADPEHWFGFFYDDWTPKPRACTFVARHGGTWPGC